MVGPTQLKNMLNLKLDHLAQVVVKINHTVFETIYSFGWKKGSNQIFRERFKSHPLLLMNKVLDQLVVYPMTRVYAGFPVRGGKFCSRKSTMGKSTMDRDVSLIYILFRPIGTTSFSKVGIFPWKRWKLYPTCLKPWSSSPNCAETQLVGGFNPFEKY